MDRPITTLFILMSVDGKISTGATDGFDIVRQQSPDRTRHSLFLRPFKRICSGYFQCRLSCVSGERGQSSYYLSKRIVIAPILIGGKDTSTLIDGKSLLLESELSQLGVLKLQECIVLEDSYIRLRYKVIH